MIRSDEPVDVLIAGGGFAGLTLAIALRQGLGPQVSVTVADPMLGKSHADDERASAIVAAARRLFETLGVWPGVADAAQPILDMVVTDSRVDDAVRPVFLTFAGDVEPGEPFAHMIENRFLIAALEAKAAASGIALLTSAVSKISHDGNRVAVELADGSTVNARLLVAADGARSSIREQAGIAVHGWEYGQSAIVTTVGHERDHDGRAVEHFLPAGPFAILPLKGRRSSIVWTETTGEADRIMALPDDAFHDELEQRFKLHLGEIRAVGARRAHPLGFFVARSFIAERIALVGDAAHVIHPIAGQGLNMGLRDIAALGRGDCRCGETGPRSRRGGRARPLPALAPVRHHGHGACDRRAQPAVLQPLRRAAPPARCRPWPGRSGAQSQAPVHPRGRRPGG